jgi:hypothetical protein
MEKWNQSQLANFLKEERVYCYWFWFKGKINRWRDPDNVIREHLNEPGEWTGQRFENGFYNCLDILESKITQNMNLKEHPQPFEEYQKNFKRITDIIEKSGADIDKMISLAKTQASKITNEAKAINRAIVAKKMNQEEVFEVFFQRAYELGSITTQEYREYKLDKLGL